MKIDLIILQKLIRQKNYNLLRKIIFPLNRLIINFIDVKKKIAFAIKKSSLRIIKLFNRKNKLQFFFCLKNFSHSSFSHMSKCT